MSQVPKEPHDKCLLLKRMVQASVWGNLPCLSMFCAIGPIYWNHSSEQGNGFDVTIATHCKAADDRPSSQFTQEIHRSTQKLSFPTQKLSPNYFWGFNLFAGKAISETPNVLCEKIEHGRPEHKDSGRPAKTHRTHTHTQIEDFTVQSWDWIQPNSALSL